MEWSSLSYRLAMESLDEFIHQNQQRLRDREPERFRGLHVDDQLELRRLFDGKVGGLRTLEDLVNVIGRLLSARTRRP